VILPRFEFVEPETFEEVYQIVEKNRGDAVLIAGGTDLLVNMKKKTIRPKILISLEKINSLKQINYSEPEGLTLGSMVTINECIVACPLGAIQLDIPNKLARKCDLCNARLENGFAPACVIACPYHCIIVGEVNDICPHLSEQRHLNWHYDILF